MVGSLIQASVNHPDDYRYQADVKGVIIKQSGSQCRVHIYELNGKSVDRVMLMHSSGFRYLAY